MILGVTCNFKAASLNEVEVVPHTGLLAPVLQIEQQRPQTPLATAAPVDVPYLDAGSGAAQPLLLGSVGGGGERTESPLRERLLVN